MIQQGRKKELVVSQFGRDQGRHFLITEASAMAAEKWAWRLFLAVKGTNAEVPPEHAAYGIVEVARRGINAFLASDIDFEKLEPLLDEMMACVQLVRDPSSIDSATGMPVATPMTLSDDIQEVQTIGWLRSEVLRVHTNFSVVEAALAWVSRVFPKPLPDSETT